MVKLWVKDVDPSTERPFLCFWFFLKCYLVKHVVGYSLSLCEFVSFTEMQSCYGGSQPSTREDVCLVAEKLS